MSEGGRSDTGTQTGPAVEIVTIGNELLLGETIDGNAAWLGQRLAGAGIRVARRATVGDSAADIRDALAQALARTGVVVCTGGLGPTRDDVTKQVAADLTGRPLRLDEGMLDALRQRYERAGRRMAASNRSQAEVPEGAHVFTNRRGSAPGLALDDPAGGVVVLLPGVPSEMRDLFDEQVLPFLLGRWPERAQPIRHHVLRTTGIPESELGDRLEPVVPRLAPLEIAFLPSAVGVDLRLTSWAALPERELEHAFDRAERVIRDQVGQYVYGSGADDLVDAVASLLRSGGLRLGLAESCTGGLIAKRLTDRAGSSDFLEGGAVVYSNRSKSALLDVDARLIEEHGAVSEPVARAMAAGARRRFEADAAIAVTGIAGPGGGSEDKPVGTVWIAVSVGEQERARRFVLPGAREDIRDRAAQAGLALLWRSLRRETQDDVDDAGHADPRGGHRE